MLLHGHKGKVSRHRRWFYEYEDGWKTGQDAFLQAVSQQRLGHAPGALPRGRVPAGLFVSPKGCRRGSVSGQKPAASGTPIIPMGCCFTGYLGTSN